MVLAGLREAAEVVPGEEEKSEGATGKDALQMFGRGRTLPTVESPGELEYGFENPKP